MSRKPKLHNLGVRVDDEFNAEINRYSELSDTNVAQLFRQAIKEYMWSHPIPPKAPTVLKPPTIIQTQENA